jgi:hypothetical protein
MGRLHLLEIILTISLLIIGLLFLVFIGTAARSDFSIEECTKYEEQYHIETKLVPGSWFESAECYIMTEDGREIEVDDFDLSATITPRRVR